jgi:hypothetical protein
MYLCASMLYTWIFIWLPEAIITSVFVHVCMYMNTKQLACEFTRPEIEGGPQGRFAMPSGPDVRARTWFIYPHDMLELAHGLYIHMTC